MHAKENRDACLPSVVMTKGECACVREIEGGGVMGANTTECEKWTMDYEKEREREYLVGRENRENVNL